jgi:hypothetical protein
MQSAQALTDQVGGINSDAEDVAGIDPSDVAFPLRGPLAVALFGIGDRTKNGHRYKKPYWHPKVNSPAYDRVLHTKKALFRVCTGSVCYKANHEHLRLLRLFSGSSGDAHLSIDWLAVKSCPR